MPYGNYWAQHIKLFKQELNPTGSARFYPYQIKAYHELLRRLLDSPERFLEHLRQYAALLRFFTPSSIG